MKKYVAVLSGTVIEYYDYALYGFTAIYVAQNFFPDSPTDSGLLKAFMVFAVGSIAKPIGALTFSHFGDSKGRKHSLKWSMIGIAIPTLAIGLLPTYQTWGWGATLALIFFRFLQGFLVSGEYDGVAIYIQEHISPKFACLGNSLLGISFSLGILLASFVVGWCTLHLDANWAWRTPYLVGGLMGIVCLFLRKSIPETKAYKTSTNNAPSFRDLIRSSWPAILSAALICGSSGAIYQFAIVFWPTFLRESVNAWSETTVYQASIALTLYTLIKPAIGYAADKIGPERFLAFGALLFTTSVTTLLLKSSAGNYHVGLYYLVVATIPFYGICGHVVLTKYIPVKERYRCINIGHSIGSMIFSGTTPAVAMWLWTASGNPSLPLMYLLCFAPFSIGGLLILKHTQFSLSLTANKTRA